MEKTVLLVSPAQRAKLSALAKRAHVSAAEINRRAIDAYDPESVENQELEQLAETLIASNAKALQAIKEAQKSIKETINCLSHKKHKEGTYDN